VLAPAPEAEPATPAAPIAEQPTQELSLLDPDHPSAGSEFQWPRRESPEAGSSWATAPTGLVGAEPSPEAAAPAEAVPAEPGEEAGPAEIPVDEPDAAVDDVTPASSEEAGPFEVGAEEPADATAPAEPATVDTSDDVAPAPSEDAGPAEVAAEEPADATADAVNSGSDADDGAPTGDPPRDQAAGPDEPGGVNGVNPARDDDTFFHPAERRP